MKEHVRHFICVWRGEVMMTYLRCNDVGESSVRSIWNHVHPMLNPVIRDHQQE